MAGCSFISRAHPESAYLKAFLICIKEGLIYSTQLRDFLIKHSLQEEIPGLGEVVAFDVKHIYAWAKENNPRVCLPHRYDKHAQPVADPDCKLGGQT